MHLRLTGLRSPPLHNPSPRFHLRFHLKILYFLPSFGTAFVFSPDAPIGNGLQSCAVGNPLTSFRAKWSPMCLPHTLALPRSGSRTCAHKLLSKPGHSTVRITPYLASTEVVFYPQHNTQYALNRVVHLTFSILNCSIVLII